MKNRDLIYKLKEQRILSKEEFITLLQTHDAEDAALLAELAREITLERYGNKIYIRGLIEVTNYCKNDCYYCGIRFGNKCASRYRLSKEDILLCCESGYGLGFRTFVLQGGEDPYFTDDRVTEIVAAIRKNYPDCAITLSLGERTREAYQRFYDAGANRYLLRHETANAEHYAKLHPQSMSFEDRMQCLRNLKEIGYQVGCGCMIGAPYQTAAHLAEDLLFMASFQPHMIGMGPFIPHSDTPFKDMPAGSAQMTILMLSISRLMLPDVLLPATTALGTIRGDGRQLGILAGANVVMPNLSPVAVREKYMLYNNKIHSGDDAAEGVRLLSEHVKEIGYETVVARGDFGERAK